MNDVQNAKFEIIKASHYMTGSRIEFLTVEPIAKPAYFVAPAKAGVQKILKRLDTVFRRYDVQGLLQLVQINNNAWNTQIRLYSAARTSGMSHAEIMQGNDNNGLFVFFNNGWLFSVGELRVPPLGSISPDGYTREQVYGAAQYQYDAIKSLAYYQLDKDTVGANFKKILNPSIAYSPANSTAPADINFSADPGCILSAMNISLYSWDFGDGSNGTGQ